MQLQLQEQISAGDQQMLEASVRKQFLEHENDKLKKERADRMQMHLCENSFWNMKTIS